MSYRYNSAQPRAQASRNAPRCANDLSAQDKMASNVEQQQPWDDGVDICGQSVPMDNDEGWRRAVASMKQTRRTNANKRRRRRRPLRAFDGTTHGSTRNLVI